MAKLFKSLLGVLRGGVHPREIGLAVFFGTLAGFASGWYATLALVLLAALVVRAPIKMFAQVWALAAALAWGLTPVTLRVGEFLLNNTALGAWMAPHQDSLWLAIFSLDAYVLIGGLAIAPVIGLVAAWTISRTARAIQERFRSIHAKVQACQQWEASRSMRIACWFLFGSAERAKEPPATPPLVRTWGVALAGMVLGPAIVVGWWFLPGMMEAGVLRAMSMANGAEVNAEHIEISLSDGRLYIRDLQVADPDKLDHDRLRVYQLTAQLRPGPLLRGIVYVDWVLVDGILCGTKRKRLARPFQLELPDFGGGPDAEETVAAVQEPANRDFSLSEYTQDWGKIEDRLKQAKELLGKIEELAGKDSKGRKDAPAKGTPAAPWPDTMIVEPIAVSPARHEMRSLRHAFGPAKPRVWIRRIRLAHITPEWGLGDDATMELTELTSDPPRVGKPTRFELSASDPNLVVQATFNLHQPGTPHAVRFEAKDVELNQLVDTSKLSDTFAITGGKLRFRGDGMVTSQRLDLPLEVDLQDLKLQLAGQSSVAGLSPELWNQGLEKIDGLDVRSQLVGRWRSPRLRVNTDELAAAFQQRLREAGQLVLAKAVGEQLARGKAIVVDAVADATGKAADAVTEQTEKVQVVIDQGHERVAQQVTVAEKKMDEKMDQVQRKASDVQAKAEDNIEATAQDAQQEIARGQSVAKEWLQGHNPIGDFGDFGDLGGGKAAGLFGSNPFGLAAGGLIDQAAHGLTQQVKGGRQASTQAVDTTGSAVRQPAVQQAIERKPASNDVQTFLNDTKNQLQSGVQQTQSGVNDQLAEGAAGANRFTERTAENANSYLPGGPGEPTTAPANRPDSVVGPYTEVLPGGGVSRPTTPPFTPPSTLVGESKPPSISQDDTTQRFGTQTGAPSTPSWPVHSDFRPPGGTTPSPNYANTGVPAYDPRPATAYPPRVAEHAPGPTTPPSVAPRTEPYPSTPFQYPTTSGQPSYKPAPGAETMPPSSYQPAPGAETVPPSTAPRQPRSPAGAGDSRPYQYPTTRSRPPAHARRPAEGPPPAAVTVAKPPYAYEAGGRYELTQPQPQPQPRVDPSPRPPHNPSGPPGADAFPGPPLPPARNFPPPTAVKPRAPAPRPRPSVAQPRRRMVMDSSDPFAAGRPTGAGPASEFLPARVPPQDDRWAITRWAEDAGSGVKGLFFGSPESTRIRQNRQSRTRNSSRMARRPLPPTYAPRRPSQQQQEASRPWYRALW